MPGIFPFRAYRYSFPSSKMGKIVCPPYDIIDDSLAEKLRKSPYNAIHIELPAGSPEKKYKSARTIWYRWNKAGIVQQDVEPAFYVYEQVFAVNGRRISRRGFFCALKVENPVSGSVLRHELTISKPKEDRLNLLRALEVNTSSIFGLFDDPKKEVCKILNRFLKQKPLVECKDLDGVTHKIWQCVDLKEIKTIQRRLRETPVIIADGHHRYETAWNYCQEKKQKAKSKEAESLREALFFLCPMQSSGLVIFPTHRILQWKPAEGKAKSVKTLEEILYRLKNLSEVFEVRVISTSPLKLSHSKTSYSFIVSDGRKSAVVKVRSFKALKKFLPEHSADCLKLSLVQLHSLLLPEMKKEDFVYVYESEEAFRLAVKNHTIVFLVPPISVQELYDVVRAGNLMPQKSTYFYPKVITGLVFRSAAG